MKKLFGIIFDPLRMFGGKRISERTISYFEKRPFLTALVSLLITLIIIVLIYSNPALMG
ncbi:MAG: hypothetical protein ACLFTZ_00585 [Acholeplasmataceae bacterium]